jgi:predicted HTH transcriptional regulator
MTLQELRQLAALGEGSSLEFKRRVPRPERIAKEIIALANTDGGRILLGVDDDGTLTGVDDAAEEEFVLRHAVKNHCWPEVQYQTERVVIAPRRDVIVVTVPDSPDKPHKLIADGTEGAAYVRVKEMSVEASAESVELMRNGADESVTIQFGEKESLLMRYLNDYGRITVEQFAQLANIPTSRASDTLISMTKANVLRLHADRKEDYFTLAY